VRRDDVHADEEPKGKKKMKMIPVLQKLALLNKVDRGMNLLWSDVFMV
jgi:hypothetical protein